MKISKQQYIKAIRNFGINSLVNSSNKEFPFEKKKAKLIKNITRLGYTEEYSTEVVDNEINNAFNNIKYNHLDEETILKNYAIQDASYAIYHRIFLYFAKKFGVKSIEELRYVVDQRIGTDIIIPSGLNDYFTK